MPQTAPNPSVAYGYDTGSRYDAASQLKRTSYQVSLSTIGTLAHTYDPAGQRTTATESYARTGLPAAISSATYDAANRITGWNGNTWPASYWDGNGNLATDGTNTYTWNARNELTGITGGGTASFAYDAFGRRQSKTTSGTTTSFLYDGLNAVQERVSGSVTANMLTGGLDEVFARTDGSTTRTPLADALGSTLALVEPGGSVLTQYRYEPFGRTTLDSGSSTTPAQYTGRENDGTGLYFNRARYYSPTLQRFISEDPLGLGGGINLYAYAGNTPTGYTDPLGLKPSNAPLADDDDSGVPNPALAAAAAAATGAAASQAPRVVPNLTPLGNGIWESAASGLRYTMRTYYAQVTHQPYQQHAIDHVERHFGDMPTRPGLHGVFAGDVLDMVNIVDAIFARAQAGGPGVMVNTNGVRTYITVPWPEADLQGGLQGAARGNPILNRMFLVLENGVDVVTSFPIH
jgi:RHS repeat-associated protein